jgi:hypothetical protein
MATNTDGLTVRRVLLSALHLDPANARARDQRHVLKGR